MPVKSRQGVIALALFAVLPLEPAELPVSEVRRRVEELVPQLTGEERIGNYLGPWTTGLVKAKWLVKAAGLWSATAAGKAAADRFQRDPEGFYDEWNRRYRAAMG